jgi:hypothetical protein
LNKIVKELTALKLEAEGFIAEVPDGLQLLGLGPISEIGRLYK